MVRAALGLPLMLLALYLLGLRDRVSVLSGTLPGSALEAAGGVLYALTYFATVLVAPVLLGSSLLFRLTAPRPALRETARLETGDARRP